MHTASDDVRGASLCPRRLKLTLLTPDSAKQLPQKSLQCTLAAVSYEAPPHTISSEGYGTFSQTHPTSSPLRSKGQ
ncbi:hypothetical protein EVAR_12454_1 [Eumeta japonica]|uniref:Uncharacterized protein n=1 Tax=Eumeta variegata TaxID=151549 RepID=A0A4C1TPE8_EUMVA|nr:hypothetical protein EVAR_12454_1 [Eumeta japonica]